MSGNTRKEKIRQKLDEHGKNMDQKVQSSRFKRSKHPVLSCFQQL